MTIFHKYFSFIFTTTLLLLVLTSCNKQTNEQKERASVKVEAIRLDSIKSVVGDTYIGKVEESLSLSLGFPLGGKVATVYVAKNQKVKQGDVLVKIDDTQQQNALCSAKATLEQVKDGYQRLEKVHAESALPEVKWVEIQSQLYKAQAAYDMAKKQLKECELIVPQDGIVEECNLKIGQQLLPSQTAVSIINTDGMQVSFSVPETEIGFVLVGDEVGIVVPALADCQLIGKIIEKNITANRITHSYTVKVAIIDRDSRLLPGMMCKVSMKKAEKKGVVVPLGSVQINKNTPTVWVIKNGKSHRQEIKLALYVDGGVLVENGLTAGDSIIIAGQHKVWEGAKITIQSINTDF